MQSTQERRPLFLKMQISYNARYVKQRGVEKLSFPDFELVLPFCRQFESCKWFPIDLRYLPFLFCNALRSFRNYNFHLDNAAVCIPVS